MRATTLILGVAMALASSGCAGASMVAAKAADDLHCPRKDISVKEREMGVYEASGCGKHASYLVRAGEVEPDSGSRSDDLPDKMPKGED